MVQRLSTLHQERGVQDVWKQNEEGTTTPTFVPSPTKKPATMYPSSETTGNFRFKDFTSNIKDLFSMVEIAIDVEKNTQRNTAFHCFAGFAKVSLG